MKPFRQYITERLAIEDNPNAYTPPATSGARSRADIAYERRQARLYGGVMARVAAKALAKSQAQHRTQAAREPFPWSSGGYNMKPGWWHPTKQWFLFSKDYHVTQIVKTPRAFGISTAELNGGLLKEAEHLVSCRVNWYDSEGTPQAHTAESVRASILKTDIDLAYEVQRLAYMKGWLKVYSGSARNSPSLEGINGDSLEGINGDSIRAALREISESGGNHEVVMVDRVGLNRGQSQFKRYNPKDWKTAS
ncbi:MAG: hypothetical protein EBT04_09275 [Betaproteobacteria bacterium]|nr:hypothetical protein [Betaproteobacteria bacterium]